ncbi:aldose epimerase family protein [Granulicella arctica]|uniref:aldose epimerase family protein n=1 Tax=Granulicella arctica TaxID=940613 RepID=UPI0021E097A9|nr:aldose epimerase family protein [Granulicella arctica]
MKLAQVILAVMTTALTAQGAVTKEPFGTTPGGAAVEIYTLKSDAVEARIMTYGARIVSIKTADKTGKVADVVLGYKDFAGYTGDKNTYFGSIVGRYGNRIAHGKFSLDGKEYTLPLNDHGINTLHGGTVGFDSLIWTGKEIPGGVEMTLVSKDGDQGFPGTLTAHVKYTLQGGALKIDYTATTDKDTVLNLTNHSYFNLAGEGTGTILNQEIEIHADKFTPTDAGLIPTGVLAPVAGTPFDFTKPMVIGARIGDANDQLKMAGGYDHNWVLRGQNGVEKVAAKVHDPVSGRVLTVTTTQPGVQFYTGNFLDGSKTGPSGKAYAKNFGLCLETQHFPDSPNHPDFPTTELKPGQTMHSVTTFTFSVQK